VEQSEKINLQAHFMFIDADYGRTTHAKKIQGGEEKPLRMMKLFFSE
jgi:hypothetical protein